jgi:hypothetical protein
VSKEFDEFKDEIIKEISKEYSKRVMDKYILPALEKTAHIIAGIVIKQVNKNVRRKRKS